MKYKVTLNGKVYLVEVEEASAMLVEEYEAFAPAAPAAPAAAQIPAPTAKQQPVLAGEAVKAPMPGTVVRLAVRPGDPVKKGDVLLILEAMKMENEILAPRDGAVVQIPVQKGSAVETGSVLVLLE